MSNWFEGTGKIECDLEHIKRSLADLGAHYVGVIGLMPGLSKVELVEQGDGFVTIRTSEGVMKRTNITVRSETDMVVVELDEEYKAGSMVTTKAHFRDEFTVDGTGVAHRTVISGLEAPGFLGFFYRTLGSSSIGNAFLKSTRSFLETEGDT